MKAEEFLSNPDLNHKVFLLNGDEFFYKYALKNVIFSGFKGYEFVYTNSECDSSELYEAIDSSDLIPHPKVVYVDNSHGDLSKHKYFWDNVAASSEDVRHIVTDCKKVPDGLDVLQVECSKLKDNQKDIGKFVTDYSRKLGIVIDPKNVPMFHYLYRNNLFVIYNELKKCRIWAEENKTVEVDFGILKQLLSPSCEKDVFQFSTNFLNRRLKACLSSLPEIIDHEAPLHIFNIFKGAEKILLYKYAIQEKISEQDFLTEYAINFYYLNYTIKPMDKIWSRQELVDLLLELENINSKIKTFNYPGLKGVSNLVLKYCR